MHLGQPQCDWVSFLLEVEPDLFQMHYLEEWNTLIVARLPAWAQAKQTRVHALGATKSGKRRFVLSLWGESAQQVVHLPFVKWAEHLTRYDVKRRLYDIRPDTYERLCLALQFAKTRRNIESFKLPKRTKNSVRDSGGEGVRFGSRKSDISTKLSKRGAEIPYFETQVQDDRLDSAILEIEELTEGSATTVGFWELLLHLLGDLQVKHINAWLSAAGIDRGIDAVRHEDIPMPEKLRDLFQLEFHSDPLPEPADDSELQGRIDDEFSTVG